MKHNTTVTWKDGLAFEAQLEDHKLLMDAAPQWGGRNLGPKPLPILLGALGGCSGMDVVSTLNKMHVKDFTFKMDIEGEMATEHPMIYTDIVINYHFNGEDLPYGKIKKAVDLSGEKYCPVNKMLRQAAQIKVRIFINTELKDEWVIKP